MRVASMPFRKDVTVQTIRSRIGLGFAYLTLRLDENYAVEVYDVLGLFRALTIVQRSLSLAKTAQDVKEHLD